MLKIAEIAPLQAEKTRLTQLFQKAMKLGQAPGTQRLRARSRGLADRPKRLAQAAMENERALRAGRAATERLIAAVITAVKQSRHPVASYAPKRGLLRAPELAGISLDRRF